MQSIAAIVDGGLIRPLEPIHLSNGTEVTVTIQERFRRSDQNAALREWLKTHTPLSDEEARQINETIEEAYGKVEPDAWK